MNAEDKSLEDQARAIYRSMSEESKAAAISLLRQLNEHGEEIKKQ